MKEPPVTPSSSATQLPKAPPPRHPGGRPSTRTPEVVDAICAVIRSDGLSNTMAGWFAGVSSSSISRWKQEDEGFEIDLGRARAEFTLGLVRSIAGARKRDGSPDWRAVAWLLERIAPEEYGPPSRRLRKQAEAKPDPAPSDENASAFVITPERLAALQQRRAIALRKMNGEKYDDLLAEEPETEEADAKGEGIPETPAAAGLVEEPRAGAGAPEVVAREAQSRANIPETSAPTPAARPAPSRANLPETPPASLSPSAISRQEARRKQAAEAQRAAAELEDHGRRVQSLIDAPELYPAAQFDPGDDRLPPGMWTGC